MQIRKIAKYNSMPKIDDLRYSSSSEREIYIYMQHVINKVKVFTSSSLGTHGVLDRAVGSRYMIKSLGVNSHCCLSGDEYWAKCHFACATAAFSYP